MFTRLGNLLRFQFSLRRFFLWVTIFALLLAIARFLSAPAIPISFEQASRATKGMSKLQVLWRLGKPYTSFRQDGHQIWAFYFTEDRDANVVYFHIQFDERGAVDELIEYYYRPDGEGLRPRRFASRQ